MNSELKVSFVINKAVSDNDDIMDQIASIEDKILERGLITEYCPTGDFDFSTNFYTQMINTIWELIFSLITLILASKK